jgi:hypothetical protein
MAPLLPGRTRIKSLDREPLMAAAPKSTCNWADAHIDMASKQRIDNIVFILVD